MIVVTAVKIDNAGRIVLPEAVRRELRLSPGDSLKLEVRKGALACDPCGGADGFTRSREFGL